MRVCDTLAIARMECTLDWKRDLKCHTTLTLVKTFYVVGRLDSLDSSKKVWGIIIAPGNFSRLVDTRKTARSWDLIVYQVSVQRSYRRGRFSNAKAISLTAHWNEPDLWPILVSSCRALRSLSLMWGFHFPPRDYFPVRPFHTRGVLRAAQAAMDTLEYLSFVHQDSTREEDISDDRDYVCSFMDFPRLKHLRLSMIFIFGPEVLYAWGEAGKAPNPTALVKQRPELTYRLASLLPRNIETLRLFTTYAR